MSHARTMLQLLVGLAALIFIQTLSLQPFVESGECPSPARPRRQLLPGERLSRGDSLLSPSGRYMLSLDNYTPVYFLLIKDCGDSHVPFPHPVWLQGPFPDTPLPYLQYTLDGKLGVFTKENRSSVALWNTPTDDIGAGVAKMQDDANIGLYSTLSAPVPYWTSQVIYASAISTPVSSPAPASQGHPSSCPSTATSRQYLVPGQVLFAGDALHSPSRRFMLVLENSGNLTIYDCWHDPYPTQLWKVGPFRGNPLFLIYQADANLIMYSSTDPVWGSGTPQPPAGVARLGDDANLALYGNLTSTVPYWKTNVVAPPMPPPPPLAIPPATPPIQAPAPVPIQAYIPPLTARSSSGRWKLSFLALPAILVPFLFGLCYWSRRAQRPQPVSVTVPGMFAKKWALAELRAATDNFSNERILGKGASSTVYKAEVAGTLMAVKRLNVLSPEDHENLVTEVGIVGNIHNRNLLCLRGYCIEGNEHLIVYDFMENGSLEGYMFGPAAHEPLSWATCLRILTETASAIAYLHDGCAERIIHRDIKPGNILLDSSFKAHVADFGLLRRAPIGETHVSTKVAGTPGYLAPEYCHTAHLTEKSDVFSFGVVLFVVICYRKALTTSMEDGYVGILDKAYQAAAEKRLLDLVAPHFSGTYQEDEAMRAIMLAFLCVQAAWQSRPSMAEVVQMLAGKMHVPAIDLTMVPRVAPLNIVGNTVWSTSSSSSLSHPRSQS